MGEAIENDVVVTVGCPNLVLTRKEPVLQWLIGSPFFSPFTIISTFRCIHTNGNSSSYPDYDRESEDIRTLLPKGFEVIGALKTSGSFDLEKTAREAIDAACRLREILSDVRKLENCETVGAALDLESGEVRFFVSRSGDSGRIERVGSVTYDDRLGKSVWERGCLLHCKVPINLPVYFPANNPSGVEKMYLHATEAVSAKFKDSQVAYVMERLNTSLEVNTTAIISGEDLDYSADLRNVKQNSEKEDLTCGDICLQAKSSPETNFVESADTIHVSVLLNTSRKSTKFKAPIAEYFPADQQARLLTVDFEINVLCYAAKDLPVKYALSRLVIPGLVDQLNCMKKTLLGKLLTPHPQLRSYHFNPPGLLHPVTVIYELNYGESELKQVDIRRSLHLRLGLPLDRPLLRIANAMEFFATKDTSGSISRRKGPALLRDVHIGIPSSGVSRGVVSLIQGSYEYHHYLQDGFDDSGWGCAYRSLQTIISWFRLQYYTSIDVPSHREIQQALVEIGDKDPSFIGSRDWIGAVELSFVLDKLLGVSCKIINVRSGAELPEKCRELALHFKSQGTPIMIGGGVLAYTLLGVDYNEASGDSAFLILDPHYTGNDEHKKIVNGGWCGWKKAVDSKGRNFFLHDKFYNLLLPQRPNMV